MTATTPAGRFLTGRWTLTGVSGATAEKCARVGCDQSPTHTSSPRTAIPSGWSATPSIRYVLQLPPRIRGTPPPTKAVIHRSPYFPDHASGPWLPVLNILTLPVLGFSRVSSLLVSLPAATVSHSHPSP